MIRYLFFQALAFCMLVLFVGGYFVLGFVLFVVVFLGGGCFCFLGFFL